MTGILRPGPDTGPDPRDRVQNMCTPMDFRHDAGARGPGYPGRHAGFGVSAAPARRASAQRDRQGRSAAEAKFAAFVALLDTIARLVMFGASL